MARRSCITAGFRVSGELIDPGGGRVTFVEAVLPAAGFGRWVHCKYCDKHVRPAMSADGSVIVCDECGYGLSPTPLGERMAWDTETA